MLAVSKELKELNAFSFVPPQNCVQSAEKGCCASSSGTYASTPKRPSTSIKWWIIKRYGSLLRPSLIPAPFHCSEAAPAVNPRGQTSGCLQAGQGSSQASADFFLPPSRVLRDEVEPGELQLSCQSGAQNVVWSHCCGFAACLGAESQRGAWLQCGGGLFVVVLDRAVRTGCYSSPCSWGWQEGARAGTLIPRWWGSAHNSAQNHCSPPASSASQSGSVSQREAMAPCSQQSAVSIGQHCWNPESSGDAAVGAGQLGVAILNFRDLDGEGSCWTAGVQSAAGLPADCRQSVAVQRPAEPCSLREVNRVLRSVRWCQLFRFHFTYKLQTCK